jgi:hypothetical protein
VHRVWCQESSSYLFQPDTASSTANGSRLAGAGAACGVRPHPRRHGRDISSVMGTSSSVSSASLCLCRRLCGMGIDGINRT